MQKLLITEIMDDEEVQKLKLKFDTIYDQDLFKNEEKIIQLIPEIDALIVRNNTLVSEAIIRAAKNLKVIGRLGVGLNNIK
jgi:(S)-sulfolactate dehydrogenase